MTVSAESGQAPLNGSLDGFVILPKIITTWNRRHVSHISARAHRPPTLSSGMGYPPPPPRPQRHAPPRHRIFPLPSFNLEYGAESPPAVHTDPYPCATGAAPPFLQARAESDLGRHGRQRRQRRLRRDLRFRVPRRAHKSLRTERREGGGAVKRCPRARYLNSLGPPDRKFEPRGRPPCVGGGVQDFGVISWFMPRARADTSHWTEKGEAGDHTVSGNRIFPECQGHPPRLFFFADRIPTGSSHPKAVSRVKAVASRAEAWYR